MTTFYSASNQLQPLAAPHEHDSNTWTPNNSAHSYDSSVTMVRDIQRISSPTPSEKEELKEFDGFFKKVFRKKSWQDKNFKYTVMGVSLAILLIVLLAVFHKDIVDALAPVSEWIKEQPAGFLIPIAFITILSIPPLLGAEIIQFMCGMIYGMWTGFAIVCAGTVLGEALTFFLFRYWLRSRAEKMEKSSLQWSALSRVIRESGFWVALVIRYSAVPTHISTGFYAACGLSFFLFLSTLVLALPRQLAGVVLGDLAAASATGETSKTDKIVSNTVLTITVIVTVFAMKWINKRMKAAALVIIRERRATENAQLVAKEATFSNTMPYDPVGDAELGRSHAPQEASEADAKESR